MAAGAIAVPTIIPLRAPTPGQHKTCIDSNTKIELRSETPGVSIYYTLNGQNPAPFQKHGPIAKATMKYQSPFRLPGGKRTVKAVAVTGDGLRESFVVTKAFEVEQLAPEFQEREDDGTRFMDDIPASDRVKRQMAAEAGKMMTSKQAWAELQRAKHAEDLMNDMNLSSSRKKPGTGPRFMNQRLGTDRSGIPGGSVPMDMIHGLSSTEVDAHYRSKKMPPDTATQALRLQRETDFLKCVYCFASRPADPYARFCNECGNPLQQIPQNRMPPPEAGQIGTCVSCNSQVPFNTTNCVICEALIPPQNQPQAKIKLADKLVCTLCGTGNPANLLNCITCEAKLPLTGAAPLNSMTFAPSQPRNDGRLLTCTKCGRVNNSDARYCDWCGTKPAPVSSTLTCTKCHASNNPYARFCGACSATLEPPQRPEVLSSGITVTQNGAGGEGRNSSGQWLPVTVRNPNPKYDMSTQTVGLFYPSNKDISKNRDKEEERMNLEKEMRDKRPVLTAISPGRGYWRKQIDHICAHIKAHAQNNAEFRALIGEPKMGKVISTGVHEDGYELSLTVNFALRGNKDPFVGERMGYSKREFLSTMARKASLNSYGGSQDSLVSPMSTARSRSGKRKATKKKKVPKESRQTAEDKMLLKEVGKAGEGDPREVEKLIEEGADPNVLNKDDLPVLHVATLNKKFEAIPVLVQQGAEINKKGPNKGNTALHEAISLGYKGLDVIDSLLGSGANTQRKNDKGETAYDLAVKAGETEVANRLSSSLGQSKLDKFIKTSQKTSAQFEEDF